MRPIAVLLVGLSLVACEQKMADLNGPDETPTAEMPATDPAAGTAASAGAKAGTSENDAPPVGAPATGNACLPKLDCQPPPLDFQPRGFRSAVSTLIAKAGDPFHRGRDLFLNPGKPQTVIGKFTYGKVDKDLKGEEIDIFIQKDCASGWTKIGTAITTEDDEHPPVEGVTDTGGRVYFEIPKEHELGPGLHRIRQVVAGDGSFADSFIDVVPPGTPFVVSDVDGTLTESESAEFGDFLAGTMPATHESAPEAFQALAAKGYRILYMTARPELFTERTRQFVQSRHFPQGLVRTTQELDQFLTGSAHTAYKAGELKLLAEKGLVPTFAFGNKKSDSDAYVTIKETQNRIFYQIDEDFVGRRIESYSELLAPFKALPEVCRTMQ